MHKIKEFFHKVWLFVVRYPMAIVGVTVFFLALALLFIILPGRAKRVNIGGALGWIFGEKDTVERLPAEVQRPVPPGVPDKEGFVEHESAGYVKRETSPFRDKSKVVVVDQNGMEHPVKLPVGVQDEDVRRVVEVHGDKVVVEVISRPAATVTGDMLKYFIVGVLFVCIPSNAYGQDCPQGYKCFPDAQAAQVKAVLEEYACMERAVQEGLLKVSLEPYRIVITHAGQVIAQELVQGDILWCNWELRWKLTPEFQITKEEPPQIPSYGARVRVRAGIQFVPDWDASLREAFDPVLFLESFYWRAFHVSSHVGLRTLGTGIGVDITNTVDAYVGIGVTWGAWEVLPVLGLSVALH